MRKSLKLRCAAFVACFLALLGGFSSSTVPPPPVSSSESAPQSQPPPPAESEMWWEELRDLSGKPFNFTEDDRLLRFEVDHAIGWTLDSPTYKEILTGDIIAGYKVSTAKSSYSISRPKNSPTTAMPDTNDYYLNQDEPLNGVLMFGAEDARFFPYYNEDGENFPFLCEMTDEIKKQYSEQSIITLEDGQTLHVQPIGFSIGDDSEQIQKLCVAGSGNADCPPNYRETMTNVIAFDVTIAPTSQGLSFGTFSHGPGGGMWGTRGSIYLYYDGVIEKELITVNSVLGTADYTFIRNT